ncbi:MAG: N-acetylneuraminate synthase family protein [Exilispira sp.]
MKKGIKLPSIIAEIGCNFNGSLQRALKLSELAIENGADYLKYQFFYGNNLINEKYYKKVLNLNSDKLVESINAIQLKIDEYEKLFSFNETNQFNWGVSFFSIEDAKIFFEDKKFHNFNTFSFIKIASGEITDYPLLEYLSCINKKLNLPIIISTGISKDSEIKRSIKFFKNSGEIYLLHCIVEYPIQTKELNLNRINRLHKKFGFTPGFSDHSLSIIPSIISLFFGSKIIEKHFTDNRDDKSADNPISILPEELKELKDFLKIYHKFAGNGKLKISDKELHELTYARKGLYASKKISKDSIISPMDISSRRPNLGYNDACLFYKFINKKAKVDIEKDEPLNLSQLL